MDDHDEMTRARIRELNDRLRRTGVGGRVILTRSVATMSEDLVAKLIMMVRTFDAFSCANDPWGEHDFGQVEMDGTSFFWKIDAYDLNLEYGSPDSLDETVTRRILTIMTGQDV